ncbi:MAG: M20/M25/M40 family metallo-hydrolase [Pseudoclavibacter sp.]
MNRDVPPSTPTHEPRGEAAAERLARLIRVPTVSAGENPAGDDVFAEFRAELESMYPLVHERCTITRVGPRGLQFRWDPRDPSVEGDPDDDGETAPSASRPHAAAPSASRPRASAPRASGPLVLMAHADVVPARAEDGWRHPPFDGAIADGAVHGRGALDDKGPLVAIFEAAESLAAEGFDPTRPLIISIGGDEETGGTGGADAARALDEAGLTPWLVLDEGGAVVDSPLPLVRGDMAMIGVAEKGFATIRLRSIADPGHSSTPSRRSAPSHLAAAVTRLQHRPFRPRLTRPVRAMLQRLADAATGPNRLALRALARGGPLTARLFVALGGEPAALVRTTCVVTMLQAGTAANVIAADATATLNLRLAPGETVAAAARRIRRVIRDRSITVEVESGSEPTSTAPVDDDRFAAISDAVAASYPRARPIPYLVMATTDGRHFHRRWPHVYRFAPIAMTSSQRGSIHGVDEHVTIDALERAIEFHLALIRDALSRA